MDDDWTIPPPFRDILWRYDPDYVAVVDRTPSDRLRRDLARITNTFDGGVVPTRLSEPERAFFSTPVEKIYPPVTSLTVRQIDCPSGGEQALVLAALEGLLGDEAIARLQQAIGGGLTVNVELHVPADGNGICDSIDAAARARATAGSGRVTPKDISMHDLGLCHWQDGAWGTVAPIVVLGDSVPDLCLFFCLSRLHLNVCWFPLLPKLPPLDSDQDPVAWQQLPQDVQSFVFWISRSIGDYDWCPDTDVVPLYTSASLSIAETEEQAAGLHRWVISLPNSDGLPREFIACRDPMDLVPTTPRVYELDSVEQQLVQFVDRSGSSLLTSRPPRCADPSRAGAALWLREMRLEGVALPRYNRLVQQVLPNHTRARVSTDGSVTFFPLDRAIVAGETLASATISPRIQSPSPLGIFTTLAQRAQFRLAVTEKGEYQKATIEVFSSLREAGRSIADAQIHRLLQKAIDTSGNVQGVHDNGTFISNREPRYLDFESVVRAAFAKDNACDVDQEGRESAAALLDALVTQGAFHRGLLLKCCTCRDCGWYPVDDLGERYRCRRCRDDNVVGRDTWAFSGAQRPTEPRWSYRLDEMVYQCWKNGVWVTIAALAKLCEEEPNGFLFVPEVDLTQDDSAEKVQLDIMCSQAGRFCVGEAKEPDHISATQIRGYRRLCKELRPDLLILATAAKAWNQSTMKGIGQVRQDLADVGTRVRSITDLSPL